MLRYLIAITASFCCATISHANCTFNQADFLDELSNPRSIKEINIEVAKSSKYNRNFYKILVSKSNNIPPELKKKFRAKVSILYEFGLCTFTGSVKQNGDWKDHIALSAGGKPIRSLNVKLNEGNIANAIKFKLLLPTTRNDNHEVLGAILLRELGFISPETFRVQTNINGARSVMLFQEDSQKELIERNNRREGPLFEGDESLLWSYKEFENFALEPIALSRVTNKKWFLKGASSQKITLRAYAQLQDAYLEYSQNIDEYKGLAINPNITSPEIFERYFFTLTAMNGGHALRPHNRKYYFNSFLDAFEPVYYDGNLSLDRNMDANAQAHLRKATTKTNFGPLVDKISSLRNNEKIYSDFFNRALLNEHDARDFFYSALSQLSKNADTLLDGTSRNAASEILKKNDKTIQEKYIESMKKFDVEQELISSIEPDGSTYVVEKPNGHIYNLSPSEIADILSNNNYNNKRYVYLPTQPPTINKIEKPLAYLNFSEGEIIHHTDLAIEIDEPHKILNLTQASPIAWAFIKNANLSGWKIQFHGVTPKNNEALSSPQRFNEHGLTGCLNFFNSNLNQTSISVNNGQCEDSLNIVSSDGTLDNIRIINAYADAIDADFSQLSFKSVFVDGAGNDCFDVSGGDYKINSLSALNCQDKGISVGEKSTFNLKKGMIKNSGLGIAIKDYSDASVHEIRLENTPSCYEVHQKKQEFGGARLVMSDANCVGSQSIDSMSRLLFRDSK